MFYKNGQPCPHPGCLNHSTHPCEICGRINGKYVKMTYEITATDSMMGNLEEFLHELHKCGLISVKPIKKDDK
jgi:hypothetical protein